MKVTIDPPEERKVTLEMTEGEARHIMDLIGSVCLGYKGLEVQTFNIEHNPADICKTIDKLWKAFRVIFQGKIKID